jgi:hypothetical protein
MTSERFLASAGRVGSRVVVPTALAASAAVLLAGLTAGADAGEAQRRAAAKSAHTFVVVAAGDISPRCGRANGSSCAAERTARRVEAINPRLVLTLGDNQYDYGTLNSYRRFYDTTWGRFKSKTRPTPGNHESYDPNGASSGYREYFGKLATPNGRTYYSFDVGNWHFVALDSNLGMGRESRQTKWLRSDLAANRRGCILAYWHHPLFSSGAHGNNPLSRPIWRALYDAKADLVLNGHDHQYERFAPQQPKGGRAADGIRELIVGTGGASAYRFTGRQVNSELRLTGLYGVLKLTLGHRAYHWELIQDNGRVRDRGAGSCH